MPEGRCCQGVCHDMSAAARSTSVDRNLLGGRRRVPGPTPTGIRSGRWPRPRPTGRGRPVIGSRSRTRIARRWCGPAKGDGRRLTPVRFLGRHRRTIGRILRLSRSVQSREAMNSVTIRETVRPNLMTAPAVYVSCELGAPPPPPQNGSAPKALVSHWGFFSITRRNEAAGRQPRRPLSGPR